MTTSSGLPYPATGTLLPFAISTELSGIALLWSISVIGVRSLVLHYCLFAAVQGVAAWETVPTYEGETAVDAPISPGPDVLSCFCLALHPRGECVFFVCVLDHGRCSILLCCRCLLEPFVWPVPSLAEAVFRPVTALPGSCFTTKWG